MNKTSDATDQLAALAELDHLLDKHRITYWLFGGWAVDFHAGRVTREHGDIDVAVWRADCDRLDQLLVGHAWMNVPDAGEDGYTCYERGAVRLEVAFLARDDTGHVYTPLREGRGEWPDATFGEDILELLGVRAHVIRLEALIADKSVVRNDASTNAKDHADVLSLTSTA